MLLAALLISRLIVAKREVGEAAAALEIDDQVGADENSEKGSTDSSFEYASGGTDGFNKTDVSFSSTFVPKRNSSSRSSFWESSLANIELSSGQAEKDKMAKEAKIVADKQEQRESQGGEMFQFLSNVDPVAKIAGWMFLGILLIIFLYTCWNFKTAHYERESHDAQNQENKAEVKPGAAEKKEAVDNPLAHSRRPAENDETPSRDPSVRPSIGVGSIRSW